MAVNACSATGNGVAGLLTAAYSDTHVYNSRLAGRLAPGWVDSGGRVWFGNQRVEGGRENVQPGPLPQAR